MAEKKIQFLVWLPKDLAKQVRMVAVEREETNSALVERALRKEIAEIAGM